MASFSPNPLHLKLTSTSAAPSRLWAWTSLFNAHKQAEKKQSFQFKAVYTPGLSLSSPTSKKPTQRGENNENETDDISILNERIRRDFGKREATRPVMDSEEADKYIQLVKEQQQKGLQKLKGKRAGGDGAGAGDSGYNGPGGFTYKVDPYSLRSGDYVVHTKVGIGKFVGIKFDVSKDSSVPIEFVFIEYADGMAKLPVKQASRMLYRYNL